GAGAAAGAAAALAGGGAGGGAAAGGALGGASINAELAEHQRWAQAGALVGEAGSDERAAYLADAAGTGLVAGLETGFVDALLLGVGIQLLEEAIPIPGLGLVIGGAMALHGIIENWDNTTATIGKMGSGGSIYEELANDLAGIATIIDLICQILNVIGGI